MSKIKWSIPVPKALDEALEQAIKKDTHLTKADFVRDAVRRRLEELGYKPQVFFTNKKEVKSHE
jgi:Arc/MetJ-type ribon-helix-helix transcriptional regulator